MLLNFEHVGVTVGDLDRSLHFYVDQIGMTLLLRRASADGAGEVAFVETAGARLELVRPGGEVETPARRPGNDRAGLKHLTFTFDDVDATYDRLIADGVKSVEKPRAAFNSDVLARVAFVLDPDGIVVELAQRPS